MLLDNKERLGSICWKCKKNPATTEINGRPVCDKCANKTKVFIRTMVTVKQKEFLNKLVEAGHYTSISEAVRAGISILEDKYPEYK